MNSNQWLLIYNRSLIFCFLKKNFRIRVYLEKYLKSNILRYQELLAYQKSFKLAMSIFEISRTFPKEEKFALTNQIRRSSRSVSAAVAESYGKRKYPKHFINKLTNGDSENLETQTWLHFARECEYIDLEVYKALIDESRQVGRLISYMIRNPEKFGSK